MSVACWGGMYPCLVLSAAFPPPPPGGEWEALLFQNILEVFLRFFSHKLIATSTKHLGYIPDQPLSLMIFYDSPSMA